jgi:hypothetical protein
MGRSSTRSSLLIPDEEDNVEGGYETQNRKQEGTNCENESDEEEEEEEDEEDEREFNFMLSSGSSNDRADPNLSLSPSDDLFFKGRLVPIEPFFIFILFFWVSCNCMHAV